MFFLGTMKKCMGWNILSSFMKPKVLHMQSLIDKNLDLCILERMQQLKKVEKLLKDGIFIMCH